MCGTSLRVKKSSVELRDRMGIEAMGRVLKRNRLRWYVTWRGKDWARKCSGSSYLEVEDCRGLVLTLCL